MFAELLRAAALVTALSTDTFIACFGYGANRVKIPPVSAHVINLVCGILLMSAMLLGRASRGILPPRAAVWISFAILLALGVSKLFDSFIKRAIKRGRASGRLRFKLLNLNFILHVYAEPEQADVDDSRTLSPKEAVYLAAAMSLDGVSVGFGTGLSGAGIIPVAGMSLLLGYLAVVSGASLGRRVAEKITPDLSWLSGALLIILAVLRLT